MKPEITIYVRPSLLTDERAVYETSSRLCLSEIIETYVPELARDCPDLIDISINEGAPIPPMRLHADGSEYFPWEVIRPKPGARVYIRLKPPEGSQGAQLGIGAGLFTLGAVLFATGIGGPIGIGLMFSGAGMVAGGLLQPPAPKNNSTSQATSFSLTGTQNGIAQVGQLVPFVAGRWNKVFPLHVAQPYTTWQGSTQYMHCLLSAGLGPLLISNVRIGDTLIDDMKGVTWQLRSGRDTDAPTTLYPSVVYEALSEPHGQAIQITHSAPGAQTVQMPVGTVDHLFWEFTFPQGIFRVSSSGKVSSSSVTLKIELRHLGSSAWTTVDHHTVSKKAQNTTRYLFDMDVTPNPSGWESRVTRESFDNSGDNSGKSTNGFYWTAFRGHSSVAPVRVPGHSLIALKIPATQSNQGSLAHISCDCTRYALSWDGSQWAEVPTANPAAVFRSIPQHRRANRGEIFFDSQIDLAGLQAWHQRCAQAGRTFGFVFSDEASMLDRLRVVASAGRASYNTIDGKLGVIEDLPQAHYVDAIGPHNSANFVKRASYRRLPHGVRISFHDQTHEMTRQEIVAYNDGYNAGGTSGRTAASIFDDIDLTDRGITFPARAWEEGRFYLAELQHRRWTATQDMDIGGFFARRGEKVSLTQPAALLGIADGYITAISTSGGSVSGITLSASVLMEAGTTYGVRVTTTTSDGGTQLVEVGVVFSAGVHNSLLFQTLVSPATAPIVVGDYFQFGETSDVAVDVIVKSVSPKGPREISVEVAPYAHPEIEDAIRGDIDPYDPHTTLPQGQPKPPPRPAIVAIRRGELIPPREPYPVRMVQLTVIITSPPSSATNASFFDAQYRVQDDTTGEWTAASASTSGLDVSFLVPWGEIYEIQVRAGTVYNGLPLTSAWSNTAVVDCKTIPQTIVDTANVTGLQLFGQGHLTNFVGRDPHFVWRMTGFSGPAEIGEEENQGDTTFLDPTFAYWDVRIYTSMSTQLRRTEAVTAPDYVYSYEKNYVDGGSLSGSVVIPSAPQTETWSDGTQWTDGTAWAGQSAVVSQSLSGVARQITIEVRIVDTYGRQSRNPARLTVQNPAPSQVTGLSVTTNIGTIWVSFNIPPDPDWVGMKAWASTTTGFTPDDATNLLGKLNTCAASFNTFANGAPVLPGVLYYVRVAAYDAFSDLAADLNVSAEIEVVTGTVDVSDLPIYTFDPAPIFTVALGAPDVLSWTASGVHVTRPVSGTTDSRSIGAGSVSWGGQTIYVSYQELSTVLTATTDITVHVRSDRTLMAVWEYPGGQNVTALNGKAGISGEMIYAHTITGQALVTDRAIITSQLQVQNAMITNAKIVDLDASKILAGSVFTQLLYLGAATGGRITIDGTFPVLNVWDDQPVPHLRVRMGKLGPATTDWGLQVNGADGTNLIDFEGGIDGSYIKDLTVDTLKIRNGALSSTWWAVQSSSYGISNGDTSDHGVVQLVANLRALSNGFVPPVIIQYELVCSSTAGGGFASTMIISDGHNISEISSPIGNGARINKIFVDQNPNVGSTTYNIRINTNGNQSTIKLGALLAQQWLK